jgi:hypothetical protein
MDVVIGVDPQKGSHTATMLAGIDYRYLLGKGNFGTGEPKEHGRIEVENEYGALPWNDAADSGYYGLPPWAWPATGDRAIVEGYWIYDCGHHKDEDGNDTGYRSEIHPAWMVATIRNSAQSDMARGNRRQGWVAPLGPDDASYSRVTKADVWISSFGGEAVEDSLDEFGPDGEDWWQPVNSRDYDFEIPLPPGKPSPDAQAGHPDPRPARHLLAATGSGEPDVRLVEHHTVGAPGVPPRPHPVHERAHLDVHALRQDDHRRLERCGTRRSAPPRHGEPLARVRGPRGP